MDLVGLATAGLAGVDGEGDDGNQLPVLQAVAIDFVTRLGLFDRAVRYGAGVSTVASRKRLDDEDRQNGCDDQAEDHKQQHSHVEILIL